MHSHDYTGDDPELLPRQDASSCSAWATRRWTSRSRRASSPSDTYLAARRGAWIIPKYLFGRPLDQIGALARRSRSRSASAIIAGDAASCYVGDMERYGLPKPDHRFGEAHPTVSDDILYRIAHGDDHAEAEHRAR